LALHLGFAREMVKIRYLVPNVSAGNLTLCHKQQFVCVLHVQQAWYTRNLRWRRTLGTKQQYASVVLSVAAAIHDSSYRQRCYTDHKQTNKSGFLGRDVVTTDVSKAGSFLFTCLTLNTKTLHSSETSETSHPTIRRHMPKDLSPQQHRSENHKSCKYSFLLLPASQVHNLFQTSSPKSAI